MLSKMVEVLEEMAEDELSRDLAKKALHDKIISLKEDPSSETSAAYLENKTVFSPEVLKEVIEEFRENSVDVVDKEYYDKLLKSVGEMIEITQKETEMTNKENNPIKAIQEMRDKLEGFSDAPSKSPFSEALQVAVEGVMNKVNNSDLGPLYRNRTKNLNEINPLVTAKADARTEIASAIEPTNPREAITESKKVTRKNGLR